MIRTIDGLRDRLDDLRSHSRRDGEPEPAIALVSTIGALHEGHIALVREARSLADLVVVSTFVNPLRFATTEEYERYPRTPDADADLLSSLGVDAVFAPDTEEFLPDPVAMTKISAGDLGLRYEGRARPGYFDGVLTVEAKLFHLVRPSVAVYGERDLQRIFLVRRMVRDLAFDVTVQGMPTVRRDDGLPVSTRLSMLAERDQQAAALLPGALEAAAANADRGVDACIAAAQGSLMGEERIRLDYLSVVDPDSFLPVDEGHTGPAIALIAATVAGTRIIDNAEICLV